MIKRDIIGFVLLSCSKFFTEIFNVWISYPHIKKNEKFGSFTDRMRNYEFSNKKRRLL